jgi:oligoribonuclease NrnB/cAMP/cGMP phosphodiesterase (DHH superfamily)
MKTYYNYVIYHKKCPDGFTGFFILHQSGLIHKNAKIMPDVPSARNPPPNIYGDVIIIDVAYKYDILKEIIKNAKSVLFIDHHITIREDVLRLEKEFTNKFKSIYDDKKSGATLVWDFIYPKKKHPKFIDLIEDNDIGKWELPNVKDFITGFSVNYDLKLNYENIKKFKSLFKNTTIQKIIKVGKIYNEYKKFLTNENSTRISLERFPSEQIYKEYSEFFNKPGQYKVAVYCGSSCPSASELAKKVFEDTKADFFISWVLNLDRKEYVLTFRSEKIDVGSIAKLFNGGGHLYAAACSFKMNKYNITDLFLGESMPRKY